MNLIDFNSPLWEIYKGAYGSVKEDIIALTSEKQLFYKKNENSDYYIAFENLFENLSHQMSFYNATYITLPYIVALLEQYENNFLEQFYIISNVGYCIATDIPENHSKEDKIEQSILDNYKKSFFILQQKTKKFLFEHMELLNQMSSAEKSEFCTSILAILGDKYFAYILILSAWDIFYILCDNCEYCDEELSFSFSNKQELSQITPATYQLNEWDNISFDDTFVWLSNVLSILGEEHLVKILSYYCGTYTCPRCGNQKKVIDFIKNYFENG